MTALEYTAQARSDLRLILRNSRRLFGRNQAQRYAQHLKTAGNDLASGVRKGRPFDEAFPDRLRFKVEAHYLVYRQVDDGTILVLRVLHTRMNIADHLPSA